jgi:hypothetical protein
MWAVLADGVDLIHALLMAAWIVGMPLLFWHRWPRLTRAYSAYAVAFIVVSQASRWLFGECIFTVIALACLRLSSGAVPDEWFTVRLAQAIFHLAPSHRSIVWVSESLILVTAIGMLLSHKLWRTGAAQQRAHRTA